MRPVALYQLLFGLVTLIGGIVGYLNTDDTIPLIAGCVAGVLLIGTGLRMQRGWRSGLYVSLVVALALLVYFGRAYFLAEASFMPDGLLSVMSIVSLLLVVLILLQPKERKRDF